MKKLLRTPVLRLLFLIVMVVVGIIIPYYVGIHTIGPARADAPKALVAVVLWAGGGMMLVCAYGILLHIMRPLINYLFTKARDWVRTGK
jgi:hypothetical protein